MNPRRIAELQRDKFFIESQLQTLRYSMSRKFPGLFYPSISFYKDWDGSEARLKLMQKSIFDYLALPYDSVMCNYAKDVSAPGLFSLKNGHESIVIDEKYRYSPLRVGAILTHESMHVYMHRAGLEVSDVTENELRTDIASILVGLGILIVNGMSYENYWMFSIFLMAVGVRFNYSRTCSLGYFEPRQYIRIFKKELKARNIKNQLLKKVIADNA